jgi:hypothetical protein
VTVSGNTITLTSHLADGTTYTITAHLTKVLEKV